MATGARPKCYSSAPGTVDRSATTVKLAWRNWLSTELATTVLDIVLREFLGYSVELVVPSLSDAYWGQSMAQREFDADLEVWSLHPGSPDYLKYVVEESVVEVLGPIGYPGRSGLFVNKRLQDHEHLSDYYKFWQRGVGFKEARVARFGQLDLSAWLGEDFPFCKAAWCPKGLLEGYWAPPQCLAEPETCALLIHPTPDYDQGYFEQLVVNHNLSAVVAYAGWDSPRLVRRLVDEGKNVLFYWWEPDPLLPLVQAERVAFPDFEYGCMTGASKDPFGSLWCDYPETLMPKVVRSALRKEAPEAYVSIKALEISAGDIKRMMASTTKGGGSLDVFEAACSYVKAKEASVVAAMAPPCISVPKPTPGPSDLVFDPTLMVCRAMVAEDATKSCLPHVEGSVDRKTSLVKVAVRDWSSHVLASAVLEILLRDYLRYSVQLVNASRPAAAWRLDMEEGAFDVDVENWQSTAPATFEMRRGSIEDHGLLGYMGRSSIYVLQHTLAKSRFADYWRFYTGDRGSTDFFRFADLDLRAMLGADFPICSRDTHPWCGSGRFTGIYAPPACLNSPNDCAVVFSSGPDMDKGYFEQLSKNLGLKLVHAYVGKERLVDFVRRVALNGTKDLLFHWFEPDPLPPSLRAVRVSFPDFSHGCAKGDTQDPTTGTVACDAKPQPLMKLVRASLRQQLPEAAYLLGRFSLTAEDMRTMLRELALAQARGWGREPGSVACEWVRGHFARLREATAPDCIARPKESKDVRVGDWVFDAEEGNCRQVSCLPQEVLLVVGGTAVCQACGEGQLPNAEQTLCVQCAAGSAPEMQESGKLECACKPGTRQVLRRGVLECQACPEGTAVHAGADSCMNCSAGRFSAGEGNTLCLLCPQGTSSALQGQASCASCPQGTYQHDEGATSCTECGPHLTTQVLGAEGVGQCICSEHFYRHNASSPCASCPEGMTCSAGSSLENFHVWHSSGRSMPALPFPETQPGYMSLSSRPLSVYACSGSESCPGGPPGTCAGKLQPDVPACSRCMRSFFWDGSHCKACSAHESSFYFFPTVPLLFCPVLVGLMYRISRDEIKQWGSWRNCMAAMGLLVLNHCQLASIVGHANMMYSTLLAASMRVYYIFEDPTLLFNPQCVGITSFRDTIFLRAAVPLILLIMVLATHCLSHAISRVGKGWTGFDKDRTANVYFSLIFTFFVGLSSMALSTFKCAGNPNGRATLIADRSVHCYEEDWWKMVAIASVAITYLLGFGALFVWATCRAPMLFHQQQFRRRWKFLFIKFRPDVWYWALLFCLRGVLTNVGFIFMHSGFLQIYWVMAVVVVYTFALVMYAPWRHMPANTMDIFSCLALISLISLLAFNIIHAPAESLEELQGSVDWAAIALAASPFAVAAGLLAKAIHSQTLPSARASKEREFRALCRPLKELAELTEDEMLELLELMDDWGRWHIVSTMRLIAAELSGLEDQLLHRLSDGSIRISVRNFRQGGGAVQILRSLSSIRNALSLSVSSSGRPATPLRYLLWSHDGGEGHCRSTTPSSGLLSTTSAVEEENEESSFSVDTATPGEQAQGLQSLGSSGQEQPDALQNAKEAEDCGKPTRVIRSL